MDRQRSEGRASGVRLVRPLLTVSMIACGTVLVSCSPSDPAETQGHEMRTELRRQQDCADKAWKATHLGLWYSVCRSNEAE